MTSVKSWRGFLTGFAVAVGWPKRSKVVGFMMRKDRVCRSGGAALGPCQGRSDPKGLHLRKNLGPAASEKSEGNGDGPCVRLVVPAVREVRGRCPKVGGRG